MIVNRLPARLCRAVVRVAFSRVLVSAESRPERWSIRGRASSASIRAQRNGAVAMVVRLAATDRSAPCRPPGKTSRRLRAGRKRICFRPDLDPEPCEPTPLAARVARSHDKTVRTSRRPGETGRPARQVSIRNGWCSSTRPARRPRWSELADGARAVAALLQRRPGANGRRRPLPPGCATTASSLPGFSTVR